jgi:spore germination cell wall hydrolase CwlJ-like protein
LALRGPLSDDAPPAANPQGVAHLVQSMMQRPSGSSIDLQCMAMVVYHEARYQSVLSQLAIAEVVANRARSGQFPRSLCKVVNQPGQFFATGGYKVARASEAWRKAVAIARLAQAEERSVVASGALFYHAAWTRPAWAQQHIKVAEIEGNIFYR